MSDVTTASARRHDWSGHRAIVVGGSIGGLTTALLLRHLGFDVSVFERTPTNLDGRGGGIVLQPDTLRWFAECSKQHPEQVSTSTHHVQYLDPKTKWCTASRRRGATPRGARSIAPCSPTSVPTDYHLGEYAAGFDQDADGVAVRFASGRVRARGPRRLRRRHQLAESASHLAGNRTRATPGTSAGAERCRKETCHRGPSSCSTTRSATASRRIPTSSCIRSLHPTAALR